MQKGEHLNTEDFIDNAAEKVTPEDEHRVLHDVNAKVKKLDHSNNSTIKELLQHVKLAFSMLKDKQYDLSWKSKTLLIAGLLYFILPSDLTPDFIPFVGYIDDAAVIAAIFKRLAHEVKSYQTFLKKQ
ncbi:MAG: YkvA family protein [Ignavibacteria bacterium]